MLRGVVVVVAVLVPLCVPASSGPTASSAFARRSERPPHVEASVEEPPRNAPAPPDRFPRFLLPLPGERLPATAASPSGDRELVLSFDDGPDLFGTPLVLAALEERGLKGIFFVNGRYLLGRRTEDLARRDLVRKLAAHGHLVANHTLMHQNLCRTPDAIAQEIDGNSEVIAYATGLRPLLFRSPYGARCRALDEALHERELVQVGWNMDPQEWRLDEDAVFASVTADLRRLRGRAILLLHDTHPSAVRALPRILSWIDAENRRVARLGGPRIRILDYSVFLPERALPTTGLEPVLGRVASALGVLPGATTGKARLGL